MIKGIIPAMVTPVNDQEEINHEATKELTEKLIGHGAYGLFILGTNGEFHMLDDERKVAFTKTVREAAGGRVPLVVGAGGNSTREVIELSGKLKEAGADYLSIITPYFIQPNQEELRDHYQEIARSVKLPVLLYNIPNKTGVSLEPDTVAELAKEQNILGVKDSSGNLDLIKAYIDVTKDEDFIVLAGTDSLILDTLKAGGAGAVAATANLVPDTVISIYKHFVNSEMTAAEEAQGNLTQIRALFSEATIPAVVKEGVNLQGVNAGPPVKPVRPITEDLRKKLNDVLKRYPKL